MTIDDLIVALKEGPRTMGQLCARLGAPRGQLDAALQQLKRGGYVDRAIPNQGECHSGCSGCSMRSLCPSNSSIPPPAQETWRLTDKALARVRPDP